MVTLKAKKESENLSVGLLELAVNCKLITREQEIILLQDILAHNHKNPKISVARSLYQKKILEKDQIEFLFSVKKHIDMLMLDKKFGTLGVSNNIVRQEDIDKALAIQVDIFKQQKKSVQIGDILFLKKEITEANKTAILLTQDRIRDEYLADAFNAIATNEMERSAINKRFGAIAVKKKLITTDQLNQALKTQKKEKKKRYLGEILKELFKLSDKDMVAILNIQKKLEIKRMNLQKKVFAYNVEKESVKILDQFMELQVSEDKLTAFIIKKANDAPKIDGGDIINWLASAGIKYGIYSKKKIQVAIESHEPNKKFMIAQGLETVPTKKEQINFAFDIKATEENILVKKDDVIATVIPAKDGAPGKDVYGHPITLDHDDPIPLSNGEGVVRRDNNFIAVVDGKPQLYENRTLFVIPVKSKVETKEIDGDISKETENNYLDCDLSVTGDILPGATVSCNSLTVKGNALGNISAASDVEIQGDIGDSNDVENTQPQIQIVTQGQLKVNGKTICAQIVTDQGLSAPHADLINSKVFSSGNVIVKNVLSDDKTPSIIQIAMKHTIALKKIDKAIALEQEKLNGLTYKSENDTLNKRLMEKAKVQQDYFENQNALSYLLKIMNNSECNDLESIKKKMEETSQDKEQTSIPKDTKAYKFLEKVMGKLAAVDPQNQNQYVQELYNNINGLFKAAVNITDRFNKKYEARCIQIDEHIEKHRDKIKEKELKIQELLSQKDYLKLIAKKENSDTQLMIKVENKMSEHTVLKGNDATLVVDKPVHGVFIRESDATEQKGAEMIVQGSFE